MIMDMIEDAYKNKIKEKARDKMTWRCISCGKINVDGLMNCRYCGEQLLD